MRDFVFNCFAGELRRLRRSYFFRGFIWQLISFIEFSLRRIHCILNFRRIFPRVNITFWHDQRKRRTNRIPRQFNNKSITIFFIFFHDSQLFTLVSYVNSLYHWGNTKSRECSVKRGRSTRPKIDRDKRTSYGHEVFEVAVYLIYNFLSHGSYTNGSNGSSSSNSIASTGNSVRGELCWARMLARRRTRWFACEFRIHNRRNPIRA